MKATYSTSCKATSRSLNNCSITQKGTQKEQNKRRITVSLFILSLLCVSLVAGRLNAAEPKNDLLRQDVLRFVGPMADWNVSLPNDSYLVRLNRNVIANDSAPASYGMLVRGVDAVEQALLQDAQDGKWDNFDLFHAAMVVEGVRDPNAIRAYETKLDTVMAQVGHDASSKEELTRKVFETLHRELLTKPYDIDCTNLGRVLETGHFNCVSATVLFNVLGEKAGLDVVALEMPGHALSRVKLENGSMNLETTCPNWFALQNDAARSQATVHRVARPIPAASLPPTGNPTGNLEGVTSADSVAELNKLSKKLREITPVQLIATIYYNQGVDFLAQKRYAEAAMANVKALHLDPSSETAWGNLMATINNWAIELTTESKRYDLAATLLDQGVYLDPNYDKFKANQLHVYYHWIRDLALEGRTADAKTVFALADQRLPNDPDLRTLMQAIERR